jgi:hypothetical protein
MLHVHNMFVNVEGEDHLRLSRFDGDREGYGRIRWLILAS